MTLYERGVPSACIECSCPHGFDYHERKPCVHGNYARHYAHDHVEVFVASDGENGLRVVDDKWCDGAGEGTE